MQASSPFSVHIRESRLGGLAVPPQPHGGQQHRAEPSRLQPCSLLCLSPQGCISTDLRTPQPAQICRADRSAPDNKAARMPGLEQHHRLCLAFQAHLWGRWSRDGAGMGQGWDRDHDHRAAVGELGIARGRWANDSSTVATSTTRLNTALIAPSVMAPAGWHRAGGMGLPEAWLQLRTMAQPGWRHRKAASPNGVFITAIHHGSGPMWADGGDFSSRFTDK